MGELKPQRYVVHLRFPRDESDVENAKLFINQIDGAVLVKHERNLIWIDCPIRSESELLRAFDSDRYAISPLRTYKLLSSAANQARKGE